MLEKNLDSADIPSPVYSPEPSFSVDEITPQPTFPFVELSRELPASTTQLPQQVTSGVDNTWQEFLIQVMDSTFFSAFFAIAGVVLGSWLTHKYTMESKVRQDNRDRLLAAVMEALQCAEELLSNFRDYAHNAPYGGGRYRDSDDPNGSWKKLRKAQARAHDVAAGAAVGRMLENTNELRKLNVNLSVFAPNDLAESFQAMPNRVTELFATLMDEGMHRGLLAQEALDDMEQLFSAALARTRDLAEVKFKGSSKSKGDTSQVSDNPKESDVAL